ncbi:hypothetical protein D3C85_465870 [compost metagenome]
MGKVAFICQCCDEAEVMVGEKYVLRANDEKHSMDCFKESGYTDKYDDFGIYVAKEEEVMLV